MLCTVWSVNGRLLWLQTVHSMKLSICLWFAHSLIHLGHTHTHTDQGPSSRQHLLTSNIYSQLQRNQKYLTTQWPPVCDNPQTLTASQSQLRLSSYLKDPGVHRNTRSQTENVRRSDENLSFGGRLCPSVCVLYRLSFSSPRREWNPISRAAAVL